MKNKLVDLQGMTGRTCKEKTTEKQNKQNKRKIKKILKIIIATVLVIVLAKFGFFAYDCLQYTKAIQDNTRRKLNENASEKVKQDTIKVEFREEFPLHWDCVNHRIVKDENYYATLKDKNNIRSMAYFITNQEVVCKFVCNKKTALKKGDVAYIYLNENNFIYTFQCLEMQFDCFEYDCRYPMGLLDYIEENRDLVFQKVMVCLDSEGIPPTK